MGSLSGRTIVVTGASRGIGRAMALRFARDGANIVIAAKSDKPHPKLGGSIHQVAEEVKAAGGDALAVKMDVRYEGQVAETVSATVERFGGLDAWVNNAGAISLTGVENTPPNRYDLMQSINARAVFVCSRAALPHLKKASNPHILSLSPPINLDPVWLKDHAPYTLSKYGMTLLTLGMSAEFKQYGIAVNCLWPRTAIATAAVEFILGGRALFKNCRKPEILADASYEILTSESVELTGQALVDEYFLTQRGYKDFDRYLYDPAHTGELLPDFFLEEAADAYATSEKPW